MAMHIERRDASQIIRGARIWFLPDGTPYGQDSPTQNSSLTNIPTFSEAKETGLLVGMIDTFKWAVEYKPVSKKGFSYEVNRYVKDDDKVLTSVKATFTTQDVVPEAFALEYGMSEVPAEGEDAQVFSLASGSRRGWLYMEMTEGYRSLEEDEPLAQIYLRGRLGLSDNPEYNDDLNRISYEFNLTKAPADSFKNLGLPTLS